MTTRTRWVLASCAALVVLAFIVPVAWQSRRDHALLSFCKEAHAGMTFAELSELERHHRIDESFVVGSGIKGYEGQAHTPDLELRSQWFDPDFVCWITHDGGKVMKVELLTLEHPTAK